MATVPAQPDPNPDSPPIEPTPAEPTPRPDEVGPVPGDIDRPDPAPADIPAAPD